ncbi:synaptic vesicular amine transporter-like isoform X2 [Gordionus sp. m RMFG-2023]|uniref:synaptic vesicular amine transporter-like isoform X2 n=1 Tax=Gordionus sp. m RMFG-2023 TaxID=3053472 RepID=UPI0031FD45D3
MLNKLQIKSKFEDMFQRNRGSRKLVLFVVFMAILLDNILLTIIVPIIPDYLYQQKLNKYLAIQNDPSNISETMLIHTNKQDYTLKKNGDKDLDYLFDRLQYYDLMSELGKNYSATSISPKLNMTLYRHVTLVEQNVKVGIMFASKAVVQLITNPFVGSLTQRSFAYGKSFYLLLVARAVQGIGSSLSSVSGMSMIADYYPDNKERGSAMGIALSGLALGVLIGPPFGGFMYQFFGKEIPFLILALFALGNGVLQLFVLQPRITKSDIQGVSIIDLIKDPLILIAAGSITLSNMGIAMLEPSMPIWMMDTMNSAKWELGIAFLPASISYLIGTSSFGALGNKFGRWFCAMAGMILIGICLTLIPRARDLKGLILPNAGLGFSIGMVDSSMMPTMGNLVDVRHVAVYGNIYAIADVAFCLGYSLGPSMSGSLVKAIHFSGMLYSIAIITFLFAPILIFLRKFETQHNQRESMVDGVETNIRFDQLTEEHNF